MLVGFVTGLAAVGAVFAAMTAVITVALRRRYPPTGQLVVVDGVALHVVDFGVTASRALPVVVIHGASGNLEEARLGLAGALSGRRTLYVDRPGHGHSSRGGLGAEAPADQARLIAGAMDALGIPRAIVVGHSWGASVAAALAVERPDRVAGLVLVSPATHPWPGGVAWYHHIAKRPFLGRLFTATVALPLGLLLLKPGARAVFMPEPMPDRYVERGRIALTLTPGSFRANSLDIWHFKANVTAMAPRYREIKAPVVVVTGDQDSVVAPWIHTDSLVRDIAGAEKILISGAGHMPHHAHASVIAEAVETVSRRAAAMAADQIPV